MEIKDVENLAELARIELTETEKSSLLQDFTSILRYIQSIENARIEGVAPKYELRNVWREDMPEARQFSLELILDQFPDRQDGYLKVKKIL